MTATATATADTPLIELQPMTRRQHERRGRPRLSSAGKRRSEQIVIRVTDDEIEAMYRLADERGLSASRLLRALVREALADTEHADLLDA